MAAVASKSNQIQSLIEGLNAAQQPILSLTSAMQKLTQTAFIPLTAATNLYQAAASGAINMMQSFVAKANPAAAFQFNRALDDLAGTMGQILTPVLNGVTVLVRTFADVMQAMRPALEPIMGSIGGIIIELSRLLAPLAALMQPAFQLLGSILTNVVVPILHDAISVTLEFADALKEIVKVITFGLIDLDLDVKAGSSVGAAVRPASYGKIDDVGRRTTLSALNQGTGGLSKDGDAITKNQIKSNDLLQKIVDKIGDAISEKIEQKTGISKGNIKNATEWAISPGFKLIKELRKGLNDL